MSDPPTPLSMERGGKKSATIPEEEKEDEPSLLPMTPESKQLAAVIATAVATAMAGRSAPAMFLVVAPSRSFLRLGLLHLQISATSSLTRWFRSRWESVCGYRTYNDLISGDPETVSTVRRIAQRKLEEELEYVETDSVYSYRL